MQLVINSKRKNGRSQNIWQLSNVTLSRDSDVWQLPNVTLSRDSDIVWQHINMLFKAYRNYNSNINFGRIISQLMHN